MRKSISHFSRLLEKNQSEPPHFPQPQFSSPIKENEKIIEIIPNTVHLKIINLRNTIFSLKSNYFSYRLAFKDFLMNMKETLISSACSISTMHFSHLLSYKIKIHKQSNIENTSIKEKYEKILSEQSTDIKEMREKEERLLRANEKMGEMLKSTQNEGKRLEKYLGEKKLEKKEFQEMLTNMLKQMEETRNLFNIACGNIKKNYEGKLEKTRRILQAHELNHREKEDI